MRSPFLAVKTHFKAYAWVVVFLLLALACAVGGYWARRGGQFYSALSLSLVSLILAVTVALMLTPRLLEKMDPQLLGRFQTVRITRRGTFFIVLVGVIGLATFNSGNNLLILLLSLLLASLLVSGIVSNLVLHGLKISLSLPESIHAGQTAVFFLTLENLKQFFPSFALKLRGNEPVAAGRRETDFFEQENFFPFLRPKQSLTLKLKARFRKRGLYAVNGFYVETCFPFGFFSRGRRIEASGRITVYPELMEVNQLLSALPWLQGPVVRQSKGVGSILYNIRDYQSGDEARHVHWKWSGKLSRLMVKNFSHEEDKPVRIILDTCIPELNHRHRNQFEKAVSFVASLCRYYREQGMSFEFRCCDFEMRLNGGKENYEALMEFLAWVEPTTENRPFPESDSRHSLLVSVRTTAGTASQQAISLGGS